MIIEMTRQVPQGIKGSIKHFLHKEKGAQFEDDAEYNEEVNCITGTSQDIESFIKMAAIKSRVHKRKYSLRHFFISPDQEITQAELRQIVRNLMEEFDVKLEDGFHAHIVQHVKFREDGSAVPHYHLLMNEVGYKSNKVMKSSSFKQKCTYVARRAELDFGHTVQPSFYSRYVIQRLKQQVEDADDKDLKTRLGDFIKIIKERNSIVEEPANAFFNNKALESDGVVYKPVREAGFGKTFSMREMNAAQKVGVNLPEVRHIFMTTASAEEAVRRVSKKFGVMFNLGNKEGVILLSKGTWKKALHKIAPLTTQMIASVISAARREQEEGISESVMASMEPVQEVHDIPEVADISAGVSPETAEKVILDPDTNVVLNELYEILEEEEKQEAKLIEEEEKEEDEKRRRL